MDLLFTYFKWFNIIYSMVRVDECPEGVCPYVNFDISHFSFSHV